ncbi:MAG: diadenylate cyclase [Deltaproteobacteria bacterium]|nr:diadenylate cyclase [Deltaproteobacteria bacterium]
MEQLLPVLSSMRWQDVLDILLNSYILFRLYVLFRGTNAFRVLIGIVVLLIFERLAIYLGLIVATWAIRGITAVAALIIIVVFRNEIRSVLQARNLRSILWGFPREETRASVEAVVDGIQGLAGNRVGALLVFPGREDLDELFTSGISWNGLVSREMILSVFWHGNPVHDGAALVRGNRIEEVGGILPLTGRKDLSSEYGTRHRAALGLSERSDALVVVVSEERGSVSVAKGGELRTVEDEDALSRILHEQLGTRPDPPRLSRRRTLELSAAAVISVVLIAGVWFSFTRGRDTLVTMEIPVEYRNRNPEMEIVNTSVDAVRLTLSGSGPLLKTIRPEQVKVNLDLGKVESGRRTFNLTSENIQLPAGVYLKKIEPQAVEVHLDAPVEKTLPVQVDWSGRLPEGVRLVQSSPDPETIRVVGSKGVLERVSTLYTEKVPLDGLGASGEVTVNVVLAPPSLKVAPGSTTQVKVRYTVDRERAEEGVEKREAPER